jgi:hypothetical protein
MKISWITAHALHLGPALEKHPHVDPEFIDADATAGGIVCGVALLVSVTPVISLLGAIWFLIIQPALH